ncbi:hypothetical protein AYO49_04035 [Verrucomicrobiaceae bacterium SCGC AG-212-N21]|nr:hypothetical protein AYO49_04035 [Verrucomicrobiaceae bacterium SCGC AG-212-N21]
MMRLFPGIGCLLLLGHLAAPAVMAQERPLFEIPQDGLDYLPPKTLGFPIVPKEEGIGLVETLKADDGPCDQFRRFTILKMPPNPWNVQLQAGANSAVTKGDTCLLVFYARAVDGKKAVGSASVVVRDPPKFITLGQTDFSVGPKWEPVIMPFLALHDGPKGKVAAAIHVGGALQKIDIGGIRLLDYGPEYPMDRMPRPWVQYEGREPGAAWRRDALKRIEENRRGDFILTIVDSEGKPVSNAPVHAVLKRHEFGFGSAVTAKWLADKSPDGDRYRAIVDECFSRVVFENDMKPFAWEEAKRADAKGDFRRAWLDESLEWLGERHMAVRGHYLCWGPFEDWSQKLKDKPQAIRDKVLEHMREIIPAVGDKVCEWDALNHPAGWEKDMCIDKVLGPEFYGDVFKEARKLTKLPLWINEDQVFRDGRQQEEYYTIIEKLIASGVKPDGIGNQAHFHSSYLPSPAEMLLNSDRFAKLVPALELTEFDVNTNGDEQLAADFTRDILILTFSHPAYTGMVMWGFWENAHWKPETALWKKDWTEKPAAKVWRDLVCKQWRTDETLKTDVEGKVKLRGFHGRYNVEVDTGKGWKWTTSVMLGKAQEGEVKVTEPKR